MGSYRVCFCFTRKFRWEDPAPPPAVREVFGHLTGGGDHMTADHLRRFLAESQGQPDASLADAEALMDRVRPRRGRSARSARITLDEFYKLLFSVELNPPIGDQVHQDMTAPVSQYYIYTGHNSYLTGNQLSSDCSDVPIIKALQQGVRVIELDMWPNSAKNDINILHGRTLTSPVDLGKCLRSIKTYAFEASRYPVVITLEDHLTPDLQAKVAKMITETFGDMLYYPDSENMEEFPSPESLKHRILISTKPPKEYLDSKKESDSQLLQHTPEDDHWGGEISDIKADLESDHKNGDDRRDQNLDEEYANDDDPKLHKNTAPSYRFLITIAAGKPKGGLREALKGDPNRVRRLSLSEQQLLKAASSYGADVIGFTKRNLLRIYPKGTRVTSSNYNPFIGWMLGAQMVAFNMQGYGRSLWLMQGFFKANGGCGFVKKPDFLREANDVVRDPKASLPVKTKLKGSLSLSMNCHIATLGASEEALPFLVTVYMGDGWRLDFKQTHFDKYSPPDFYTRVGIAGAPVDCVMKKTKIIEDNWTPVWNEEFTFPLTVPEIALLRIEVHEYDMSEKDDFGGQTCLPVSELRKGIRAVPLCDRKGEKYKSVKLLMRFEFCS